MASGDISKTIRDFLDQERKDIQRLQELAWSEGHLAAKANKPYEANPYRNRENPNA